MSATAQDNHGSFFLCIANVASHTHTHTSIVYFFRCVANAVSHTHTTIVSVKNTTWSLGDARVLAIVSACISSPVVASGVRYFFIHCWSLDVTFIRARRITTVDRSRSRSCAPSRGSDSRRLTSSASGASWRGCRPNSRRRAGRGRAGHRGRNRARVRSALLSGVCVLWSLCVFLYSSQSCGSNALGWSPKGRTFSPRLAPAAANDDGSSLPRDATHH
jgi:hypothetical protein